MVAIPVKAMRLATGPRNGNPVIEVRIGEQLVRIDRGLRKEFTRCVEQMGLGGLERRMERWWLDTEGTGALKADSPRKPFHGGIPMVFGGHLSSTLPGRGWPPLSGRRSAAVR
jgi:hypothetical protein